MESHTPHTHPSSVLTKEQLVESEQRFQTLFANVPLPSWVFDLETFKFLEVNDAAIALYGYTKEEFLSMRISDLRLKENTSQLSAALEVLQTRQFDSTEAQHRKKDGAVIDVFMSWHEMSYGGKPSVLVVAQAVETLVPNVVTCSTC